MTKGKREFISVYTVMWLVRLCSVRVSHCVGCVCVSVYVCVCIGMMCVICHLPPDGAVVEGSS